MSEEQAATAAKVADLPLEPAIIVIFGITGDLSKRYLLPSLYHLIKDGLLPDETVILGVTRGATTTHELFESVNLCPDEPSGICDPDAVAAMHSKTTMLQMDLDDSGAYAKLRENLDHIEHEKGICLNRLYYLAIPPPAYQPVIEKLGTAGLNQSCQHNRAATRLLVEKPFGYTLESATALIEAIAKVFSEEQIFRIDHYLAKETVQNILTFRFFNPIFEAIWSNQYIANITISAYETIGIAGRATFYEPLGALRDFIQSHLLQILAIVTMDQPAELNSQQIHAAKQQLMSRIKAMPEGQVSQRATRGQYNGYRQEVSNPESITETFADITVFINSDRWQGVPIRLVTGKGLNERVTEIVVSFHDHDGAASNELRFRIQPNEGIELDLATKKPGFANDMQTTAMTFSYQNNFNNHGHPDAYERVLVDAVRGDHTLFATSQEVIDAWRIVQPVLDAWQGNGDGLIVYEQGSNPQDVAGQNSHNISG